MKSDIVIQLRMNSECLAPSIMLAAADEIERLRKERDEARRDVCSMMHMTGFLGGDYAHSKGWDCFKDGHTGFSPEIQNFRDIFYDYKDKLKAERDEARREICRHGETIGGAMLEAELRGWDCFKQEDGK